MVALNFVRNQPCAFILIPWCIVLIPEDYGEKYGVSMASNKTKKAILLKNELEQFHSVSTKEIEDFLQVMREFRTKQTFTEKYTVQTSQIDDTTNVNINQHETSTLQTQILTMKGKLYQYEQEIGLVIIRLQLIFSITRMININ